MLTNPTPTLDARRYDDHPGVPTREELFDRLPDDLRRVLGPSAYGLEDLFDYVRCEIGRVLDEDATENKADDMVREWINGLEDDTGEVMVLTLCDSEGAEALKKLAKDHDTTAESFRAAVRESWEGR
jgi:hypothetical protein